MATSTTVSANPVPLNKEEVPNLKFKAEDVLLTKAEQAQRKIDLQRANALGAQSKSNIKLYITDDQGVNYRVEATVWAATELNVTLKGGVIIPNRAIYKVGFF